MQHVVGPQAGFDGSGVLAVNQVDSCSCTQLKSRDAQHLAYVQHASIVMWHVAQQEGCHVYCHLHPPSIWYGQYYCGCIGYAAESPGKHFDHQTLHARVNRKQLQVPKLCLESHLTHPLSTTHIILPLPDLVLQGSMALLHEALCPVCS